MHIMSLLLSQLSRWAAKSSHGLCHSPNCTMNSLGRHYRDPADTANPPAIMRIAISFFLAMNLLPYYIHKISLLDQAVNLLSNRLQKLFSMVGTWPELCKCFLIKRISLKEQKIRCSSSFVGPSHFPSCG